MVDHGQSPTVFLIVICNVGNRFHSYNMGRSEKYVVNMGPFLEIRFPTFSD